MDEYRDGQIADDGRGNFMVYRGGLWHRSNDKGYPLERIARPDYGDRYYQQPNGDIVREGPKGGFEVIERAADGAPGSGGGMVGAEQRGRYQIGADSLAASARAAAAEEAKGGNPLNRDWGAVVLNNVDIDPREGASLRPFAPLARVIGGQDFQNYDQALATYEASLLPIQSGANVTESEARRQIRADFPQLGDNEETVRRKAANRLRRINAVFTGLGRPVPFTEEQIADPTSIAPEDEMRALQAIPASGEQPPAAPVDISGMSPADLLKLTSGTSIRLPDGTVTRLTGTPSIGAEGREVSPGVFARETPEDVADARREDRSAMRQVDAGVRGAADTLTFGLADEIAAGANTVVPLDRGTRSGFTDGFGEAFRHNLEVQRGIDEADNDTAGVARITGQVGGGLAVVPRLAAQGGARIAAATGRQAVRAATRRAVLRGAGEGAAFGGAYGFGSAEGTAVERAPNALVGAAFGAPVGAAAPYVANALGQRVVTPAVDAAGSVARFVGRQAGRAGSALGVPGSEALVRASAPNALRSGLNRLADRAPQSVNALNTNAGRFAAETIEPTAADVVDDGARGLMRALSTRQTPARQAAREFAADRAEGLQDRIATQARRTISDDPRTPMEIREQAVQEGRRRAAPLYEQAYAQPIEVTDEIRALLQTPAGKSAMQRAQRIAANERRQINLDQPDLQTLDYVKRGLDDVLETYRDRTTGRLSLDTEGRAVQDVLASFRNELDRINPTYGQARATYADSARLQNAADLGEQFMRMEADQFAAAVARLSPEEQQIARAAARRAVERTAGTQGQAPGVAQRLAGGREQAMRSQALLDDAEPMQRAMRTELEALRNAQAVSPAQGSPTSANLQDAGTAAGIFDAISNPVRAAGVALINRIRSRGFNDQEAEAVVMASIDPKRTQEVIDILSQRMSRREARGLARVLRRQVTIGLQSGQQQ